MAETTASSDALGSGYEWGFATGATVAVVAALAAAILMQGSGDER